MSVLSRAVLEDSPLADLHLIASEIGIDGYRRLRKEDLVEAVLTRQGGAPAEDAPAARPRRAARSADDAAAPAARSRSRARGADDDDPAAAPRSRARRATGDDDAPVPASRSRARRADADSDAAQPAPRSRARRTETDSDDAPPAPRSRARRSASDQDGDTQAPRSRAGRGADEDAAEAPARRSRREGGGEDREERPRRNDRPTGDERTVDGTVEVLSNGSAFVRLTAGQTHDDDAYVSAAQVKRCELVSGDRVSGPVRPPRRSERHPSMIRVETINGASADEVAVGTPFDALPAVFPTELIALNAKDTTLKEISDLAPIGHGSRVVVYGAAGSGRSTTLRLLAGELQALDGVELHVVLAGARPEEAGEWRGDGIEPVAAALLGQSPDAQAQAVERAIDAGRKVAARGANAAVVIDAIDQLAPAAARRALAAARNIDGGGSLTVIAAATAPLGGETTLIALDAAAAVGERRPVLDPQASGTLRTTALVGARKATTIAKARAKGLTEA